MPRYIVRGVAHYNGAIGKNFEEVVEIRNPQYSNDYEDAVQAIHPDWEAVRVFSHEQLEF